MRSIVSKSAVVAALCATLVASSVFAAAGAKGDEKATMQASRRFEPFKTALSKVTGLTEEEKTKTDQILNDAIAQAASLVEEKKADKTDATAAGDKTAAQTDAKERRQKLQDLQKKTATDIEAVLTAEQKPEFEKALKEARASTRGGQGGGKAAAGDKPAEKPADPAK